MKRCANSLHILVVLALVLSLSGCALFSGPFEATVALAGNQYPGAQNTDGSFSVLFPPAADIAALRATASGAEIASYGTYLGGTVALLNVTTNKTFYVTGARIENVRYRLTPAGGNPIGTGSDIEYVSPVYGDITPLFANLALGQSGTAAVISVKPGQDNHFDLGISSALTLWDGIDVNRDNQMFPADDKEVITISCSVFLEGYLEDGMQFADTFPPPLHLTVVIAHG